MIRWVVTGPPLHAHRAGRHRGRRRRDRKGDWLLPVVPGRRTATRRCSRTRTASTSAGTTPTGTSPSASASTSASARSSRAWSCASLFRHLVPRLESLELAGEPTSMKTTFVGGTKPSRSATSSRPVDGRATYGRFARRSRRQQSPLGSWRVARRHRARYVAVRTVHATALQQSGQIAELLGEPTGGIRLDLRLPMAIAGLDPVEVRVEVRVAAGCRRARRPDREVGAEDRRIDDNALLGGELTIHAVGSSASSRTSTRARVSGGSAGSCHGPTTTATFSNTNPAASDPSRRAASVRSRHRDNTVSLESAPVLAAEHARLARMHTSRPRGGRAAGIALAQGADWVFDELEPRLLTRAGEAGFPGWAGVAIGCFRWFGTG